MGLSKTKKIRENVKKYWKMRRKSWKNWIACVAKLRALRRKKWFSGTYLAPADDVSVGSKNIDDLSLALVTPLSTQDNCDLGYRPGNRCTLFLSRRSQSCFAVWLLNSGARHFQDHVFRGKKTGKEKLDLGVPETLGKAQPSTAAVVSANCKTVANDFKWLQSTSK